MNTFPAKKRPITQEDKDAITKPITDGLSDIIFGRPGLFDDRPGFIAAPPGGNAFADTVRAISQANCRIWAGADKSNYSTAVNVTNAGLCRPYLEDIGEWPGPNEIGEDFDGGQCDDQVYFGTFQYESGPEFDPQTQTAFFVGRGPIIGAFDDGGPSSPDGTGIRGRAVGFRTGTPFGCGGIPPASGQPLVYRPFVNGGRNGRITSITPCGLDNCGDAPPTIRPPGRVPPNVPRPFPITINPPGFGPTGITVDVDPDVRPVVCFEEIDVCIPIGPPEDGPGGGPGGEPAPEPGPGPGDQTDPGTPGGGGDTGGGGAVDGEAGEGEELVGVQVQILGTPENPNVFDNNSAQVFRGIGYVRMGYPGRLGTDISGGTVINPQFFHAQQRGLTSWEVRANLGFNIRATPYYRDIQP